MGIDILFFCIIELIALLIIGAIDKSKRDAKKPTYKMGCFSILFVPANLFIEKILTKKSEREKRTLREYTISKMALIMSIINIFIIIGFIIFVILGNEVICLFYPIIYFVLILPMSFFIEVKKS